MGEGEMVSPFGEAHFLFEMLMGKVIDFLIGCEVWKNSASDVTDTQTDTNCWGTIVSGKISQWNM